MFTGIQLFPKSQPCVGPSVGASHDTDDETCKLSEPSPLLPASTLSAAPLEPCAVDSVRAVCESARRGVAFKTANEPAKRRIPRIFWEWITTLCSSNRFALDQ